MAHQENTLVSTRKLISTDQRQDYVLPLVSAGDIKVLAGSSNAGKSLAAKQIAPVAVEGCRGISKEVKSRVHSLAYAHTNNF